MWYAHKRTRGVSSAPSPGHATATQGASAQHGLEEDSMWDALLRWAKSVDEKDLSDEARHFADDAPGFMSMPMNGGEWKASLEIAFESGRRYEQIKIGGG